MVVEFLTTICWIFSEESMTVMYNMSVLVLVMECYHATMILMCQKVLIPNHWKSSTLTPVLNVIIILILGHFILGANRCWRNILEYSDTDLHGHHGVLRYRKVLPNKWQSSLTLDSYILIIINIPLIFGLFLQGLKWCWREFQEGSVPESWRPSWDPQEPASLHYWTSSLASSEFTLNNYHRSH